MFVLKEIIFWNCFHFELHVIETSFNIFFMFELLKWTIGSFTLFHEFL